MRKTASQPPSIITFYGEDIVALLRLDPNETYVVIGEVCANLGMERAAQERRIRAHVVLREGARKLQAETANGTELAWCLRVDLLPLWLVTIDASQIGDQARTRLELYQREVASMLWQSFKPQGFGTEDTLLPQRHEQNAAEQAYVAAQSMATLARQQMLIERQLVAANAMRTEQGADPYAAVGGSVDDPQAARLAQTVRRVAVTAAERSRRNEYNGIYSGLYKQFGITSYRRMPSGRLYEALEWLERWHGDLLGEPEPPPDI